MPAGEIRMADASSVSLAPVIVGGLLTMGGGVVGFIGSVILQVLQDKKDRASKRAAKFEDLVGAVYEYDHWIEQLRNIRCFGAEDTKEISPLAKVEAISATYFPSFSKSIGVLSRSAGQYQLWMSKAGMKRLHNQISEINDGFDEAYRPYGENLNRLLDELKQFAATEFQ